MNKKSYGFAACVATRFRFLQAKRGKRARALGKKEQKK